MLDQTIEAKAPISKGAIFWFLLAAVLGIAGIATGNPHFWMAGAMPLISGLVFLRSRHSDVIITLEEKGIVLFETQHILPYNEIQAVLLGRNPVKDDTTLAAPGPITIVHDHGRFFLPERMNVPVLELAKFLARRIPQKAEKEIHASLVNYTNEQLTQFGMGKVTLIHQREFAYQALSRPAIAPFGIALLICGILWLVLAMVVDSRGEATESFTAWLGFGVAGIALGTLLWFLSKSKSGNQKVNINTHGAACIVIGPSGMGLAQGELQGKLRWDEITGIKNGPAKSFGNRDESLHISFAGGVIVLLDIYDRSLMEVASLIRNNIHHI